MNSPVLIELTRGPMVESRHRGTVVVADRDGQVAFHAGDVDRVVYPRSAIKALQAIPLVESGAADAFQLSDEELALAMASHWAEPMHTGRIAAWLTRIGLSVEALECGPQTPTDREAALALARRGEAASALHNNCSGKHAGMLTTAMFKGEPVTGYFEVTHPVQQRILGVLEMMTGQELRPLPWGVDGCSVPTFAVPIGGLAVAMAQIADPGRQPEPRIAAIDRLRRAWSGHPLLIAGTRAFDSALIRATGGRVLAKGGAEGVMCACLPESGLGIAVKIDDGAMRAAHHALLAVLERLGVLGTAERTAIGKPGDPRLINRAGREVGEIRPTGDLAP